MSKSEVFMIAAGVGYIVGAVMLLGALRSFRRAKESYDQLKALLEAEREQLKAILASDVAKWRRN